ncbi:MAG: 2-C-methyl-D-erythritol 4-phosphate cytidylyltransferase [Bacteroidales bacterium]|nr:2-C-methyl-D-erythritol 4-phosphate cytidylyltransferase [Bacteroidales bacterium]
MSAYAIILAGGEGRRVGGDVPKQFLPVKGVPLFVYSLRKFTAFDPVEAIVLVVSEAWESFARESVAAEAPGKRILFAPAGKSRQHSVFSGLKALEGIAAAEDAVFVHDSVRPLFPLDNLGDGLAAIEDYDVALPVISVKDATYLSGDGVCLEDILPRSELYSGQSPECLRYGRFVSAHAQFSEDEIAGIRGCSELAFRAGLRVKFIAGAEQNFKITTKEDLQAFTLLV